MHQTKIEKLLLSQAMITHDEFWKKKAWKHHFIHGDRITFYFHVVATIKGGELPKINNYGLNTSNPNPNSKQLAQILFTPSIITSKIQYFIDHRYACWIKCSNDGATNGTPGQDAFSRILKIFFCHLGFFCL